VPSAAFASLTAIVARTIVILAVIALPLATTGQWQPPTSMSAKSSELLTWLGLLESPNGMQTRQISNAGHRLDPPGWAEA